MSLLPAVHATWLAPATRRRPVVGLVHWIYTSPQISRAPSLVDMCLLRPHPRLPLQPRRLPCVPPLSQSLRPQPVNTSAVTGARILCLLSRTTIRARRLPVTALFRSPLAFLMLDSQKASTVLSTQAGVAKSAAIAQVTARGTAALCLDVNQNTHHQEAPLLHPRSPSPSTHAHRLHPRRRRARLHLHHAFPSPPHHVSARNQTLLAKAIPPLLPSDPSRYPALPVTICNQTTTQVTCSSSTRQRNLRPALHSRNRPFRKVASLLAIISTRPA